MCKSDFYYLAKTQKPKWLRDLVLGTPRCHPSHVLPGQDIQRNSLPILRQVMDSRCGLFVASWLSVESAMGEQEQKNIDSQWLEERLIG
jgi:hypothetical protein